MPRHRVTTPFWFRPSTRVRPLTLLHTPSRRRRGPCVSSSLPLGSPDGSCRGFASDQITCRALSPGSWALGLNPGGPFTPPALCYSRGTSHARDRKRALQSDIQS